MIVYLAKDIKTTNIQEKYIWTELLTSAYCRN